jgi:hypothetical protein
LIKISEIVSEDVSTHLSRRNGRDSSSNDVYDMNERVLPPERRSVCLRHNVQIDSGSRILWVQTAFSTELKGPGVETGVQLKHGGKFGISETPHREQCQSNPVLE